MRAKRPFHFPLLRSLWSLCVALRFTPPLHKFLLRIPRIPLQVKAAVHVFAQASCLSGAMFEFLTGKQILRWSSVSKAAQGCHLWCSKKQLLNNSMSTCCVFFFSPPPNDAHFKRAVCHFKKAARWKSGSSFCLTLQESCKLLFIFKSTLLSLNWDWTMTRITQTVCAPQFGNHRMKKKKFLSQKFKQKKCWFLVGML